MEKIPAGQVSILSSSPIWKLVELSVHGFSDSFHDSALLDAKWLRDWIKEDQGEQPEDTAKRGALAEALDKEPECEGWRDIDLLYIHPR